MKKYLLFDSKNTQGLNQPRTPNCTICRHFFLYKASQRGDRMPEDGGQVRVSDLSHYPSHKIVLMEHVTVPEKEKTEE